MENNNSFEFDAEAFREMILEELAKEPKPDATMIDPQVILRAQEFKRWFDKEYSDDMDSPLKREINSLGNNSWLTLSFETDMWGTTPSQEAEFKRHADLVDSFSVTCLNSGKVEISFAFDDVLQHFSK